MPISFRISTVYCDPHSQRLCIVNKAEIDVFLELSCLFLNFTQYFKIQIKIIIYDFSPIKFKKSYVLEHQLSVRMWRTEIVLYILKK